VPYTVFQLIVLFAVPPIVLFGAASSRPEWLSPVGRWAERYAYGIYLLSYPCLEAFREFGDYFGVPKPTLGNFPAYLVQVALILLVVHLIVRLVDEPVRKWGDRKFFQASAVAD
jgi:peptidoglycan/LPS O-acetylase OafA/YrhL